MKRIITRYKQQDGKTFLDENGKPVWETITEELTPEEVREKNLFKAEIKKKKDAQEAAKAKIALKLELIRIKMNLTKDEFDLLRSKH